MEDYTVIKQLAKGGQGATMLVKHNDGSANMVLKQCKVCVEERSWMRMCTRDTDARTVTATDTDMQDTDSLSLISDL